MTKTPSTVLALCAASTLPGFGGGFVIALNGETVAPCWVQLLPRGPLLSGIDGRSWTLSDPAKLVAAFNARQLQLPIDVEHAQFVKAPKGDPAPAAGWIDALEIRDGEVFGRVAWTTKGAETVNSREYRYLSPAFSHDAQGRVTELLGAGLVNRPNFQMAALNQEAPMFKELLKKLGLSETATEADAVAKVTELQTALNSQQVSLANFVPREDYNVAVNRAATLESQIKAQAEAAHKTEAEAAIEAAMKAGKISPATKDFYVATCASAEGLAQFKKFAEAAPSVFNVSGIDDRKPGDAVALNASEEQFLSVYGMSREDYLAAKA
jgi:phage I-like protein